MWAFSHTCTRRLFFFGSGVVTSATSLLFSVVLPLDFERLCGTVFRANHIASLTGLSQAGTQRERVGGRKPQHLFQRALTNASTARLLHSKYGGFSKCLGANALRNGIKWNYMLVLQMRRFMFVNEAVCVHVFTGDFMFLPHLHHLFCCDLWR